MSGRHLLKGNITKGALGGEGTSATVLGRDARVPI